MTSPTRLLGLKPCRDCGRDPKTTCEAPLWTVECPCSNVVQAPTEVAAATRWNTQYGTESEWEHTARWVYSHEFQDTVEQMSRRDWEPVLGFDAHATGGIAVFLVFRRRRRVTT